MFIVYETLVVIRGVNAYKGPRNINKIGDACVLIQVSCSRMSIAQRCVFGFSLNQERGSRQCLIIICFNILTF